MNPDDIRKLAREEAQKVYQEYGSRFGVNQVPTHTHNNIDSPLLPQFVKMNDGSGGVLSPQNTFSQRVNTNPKTNYGSTSAYVVPLSIIYGHGVGTASQFNGGDAAAGTMILFMNPPLVIQLWWRAIDIDGNGQWYGVDVAGGTGFFAGALGPLP